MQRVDALGIAGAVMLVAGAGTFLGSYGFLPLWVAWLFGPLLWYLGFAMEICWIGLRVFMPQPERADAKQKEVAVRVARSNFLEHDYEIPMERTMRKLPVFSAFLILVIVSALMVSARAADTPAATLFTSKCAMCHGADATGKTAMGAKLNIRNLTAPEVQKQSDGELSNVIAKGRNKMPAYDTKLSKDEITQLTAYIRGLAKKH